MKGWYKISQDLSPIPSTCKDGDCYRAAGRYIMDHALFDNKTNLILVHGEVTGQRKIAGIKFGHAWIEDGDTVIDMSQGRDIRMPKALYYALGNINPSNTFRYTPEEMNKKLLEFKHWGPWDLQTEF